jgi:death on curing protein
MTEPDDPTLPGLLGRFHLTTMELREFRRTDTEATLAKVHPLTGAAIFFNTAAVADYGGRPGTTRGLALIEQVIGAAFQSYAGEDPHPTVFDKAAMLLRGITAGHPFQDGNKRTGFLLAAYYLDLMGYTFPSEFNVDGAEALSRRVSAGELRDVSHIAAELMRLWSGRSG